MSCVWAGWDFGDVPTWIGALAAILAAGMAYLAFIDQKRRADKAETRAEAADRRADEAEYDQRHSLAGQIGAILYGLEKLTSDLERYLPISDSDDRKSFDLTSPIWAQAMDSARALLAPLAKLPHLTPGAAVFLAELDVITRPPPNWRAIPRDQFRLYIVQLLNDLRRAMDSAESRVSL